MTTRGATASVRVHSLNLPPPAAAALGSALGALGWRMQAFEQVDDWLASLKDDVPDLLLTRAAAVPAVAQALDSLSLQDPRMASVQLVAFASRDQRLPAELAGADLVIEDTRIDAVLARLREWVAGLDRSPFRVLLIDDDAEARLYASTVLGRVGMQVEAFGEADAALARARDWRPDLVLLDLYMPGLDGLAVTRRLRAELQPQPQVVVLSGEERQQARFNALRVGVDDFLTKPIRPRHLVTAVRSRIKRVRALGKQLTRRRGDATGYMRRGAFLDHLRERKASTLATEMSSVLLVVSVDQGSDLQERLSLSVGHELEQAVAMRLASNFADSDRYCLIQEFGFGVYIDRPRRDALLAFADRLREAVAGQSFKVDGQDMRLTVSVGLALIPSSERSVDDWINAAFAAARTAHRLGGNRIEGILSDADSALPPERLLRIRELLRDAVDKRGMAIDFQPLIPLRGTEAGRYAMLTYLADPKEPLGGIGRQDYVPVARELGLQQAIDRMLITHALRALDDQRSLNRVRDLLVPVDFASVDRDQLAWMQSEFARRKHVDQRLRLEFDASALIDSEAARRVLDRLRADGIRLGVAERSPRLGHLGELVQLPLKVLRLPAAVLQAMDAEATGPALENWQRSGRELVVEDVRDLSGITRFWNIGADYLQGDALATASPRLDFDFSEINLG